MSEKAKVVKVDPETHARFKVECARRGVSMQAAATEAIERLLAMWVVRDEIEAEAASDEAHP